MVGYAGNLGRAHDIDTVLAAMASLQQRAKNLEPPISRRRSCSCLSAAARGALLWLIGPQAKITKTSL